MTTETDSTGTAFLLENALLRTIARFPEVSNNDVISALTRVVSTRMINAPDPEAAGKSVADAIISTVRRGSHLRELLTEDARIAAAESATATAA